VYRNAVSSRFACRSVNPIDTGRPTPSRWQRWYRTPWAGVLPFLLAVTILGRGAQNIGQTTYPLEARALDGVGNGLLGVIAAASGLASVVMATTIGARITRANALWTMAIGQGIMLLAFVALALGPLGVGGLWVGAVLLGGGAGLVFPATMTAVGAGSQPSRALSVYALALSVGLVIGPLVEAMTLHLLSQSLRGMFAVLIPVPAIATIIAIAGALSESRRAGSKVGPDSGAGSGGGLGFGTQPEPTSGVPTSGVLTSGVLTSGEPSSGEPSPGEPSSPRLEAKAKAPLLKMGAYRLALAVMLTYQAPFSALLAYGGLLARHADGASPAGVEIGFAVFYAFSFGVRVAIVRFAPVRRLRLALGCSAVLTVIGVGLLGGGHGFALFMAAMAVLGTPHGATFPFASSILAERLEARHLGRANARLMASTNGVAVGVPLACGWLAEAVGYRSMFLLVEVPVVAFACLLAIELIISRPHARPGRSPR